MSLVPEAIVCRPWASQRVLSFNFRHRCRLPNNLHPRRPADVLAVANRIAPVLQLPVTEV